jgi:methyltransferase-like protein
MRKAKSEVLYHDDLSEINQPFFFTEFNGQIEKAGLRFLSEAEPIAFFTMIYPEFARVALSKLWHDPIRREQYFDFIRGTRFRSTLVCLPSASPSYPANPDAVASLFLASHSYPLDKDANLTDDSPVAYFSTENSEFTTNHPLTKMMIATLHSKWPEHLSYDEIVASLRREFSSLDAAEFEKQCTALRNNIVELVHATLIEASCFRPKFETAVGPRPRVSDFARWQARRSSPYLTNQIGANVQIDNDFVRAAASLLDGTRDRTGLAAALNETVTVPDKEKDALQASLPDLIDSSLTLLARSALIVG